MADANGDGRSDVAMSVDLGPIWATPYIAVWHQDSAGGLPASPTLYAAAMMPEPVEVGEIDGDERADVAAVEGRRVMAVHLQSAEGGLRPVQLYDIPLPSVAIYDEFRLHGLAVGDIDGDGLNDVAIARFFNYDEPRNGLVVLRQRPRKPGPCAAGDATGP